MKKTKKNNFFEIGKKIISNEISALKKISLNLNKDEFNSFCESLINTSGNLIFLGIGKSGKVSEKISSTFSSLGRPSFYINAAEASHGDLGAITKKDTLIIFSFSGETEELVDLLPSLKKKKIKICSITSSNNSSISLASESHINLNVSKEADMLNLAPTSSTTAMMMLGDAISLSVAEFYGFKRSIFGENHPGGSLGKSFVKVKDIMVKKNKLPFIDGSSSILKAMENISKKGYGLGLITNKNQVKGIFTDGDLRRIVNKGVDLSSTLIKKEMIRDFKDISENELVIDVARIMEEEKIYSLIVKNSKNSITGIIRMHEILSAKII